MSERVESKESAPSTVSLKLMDAQKKEKKEEEEEEVKMLRYGGARARVQKLYAIMNSLHACGS